MKFSHLFYNANVNFKSIPVKRIVLSVFIGLIYAILIYYFFYCLREANRIFFLDFENRTIVIPEVHRKLYNLFFASISIILGNSIAINFLFSRPQNSFSKNNNKRSRSLNDNIFLSFSFIQWYTEIWFLFAFFAFQTMGSKFISNFFLPSVLLIVVLYLESWKTLITVIKKHRWKIQIAHFLLLVGLSFFLSRLNVIDYKSIDIAYQKKNPTINVPKTPYQNTFDERMYYNALVFKMDMKSNKEVVLLTEDNKPIEFYEIYSEINNFRKELPVELRDRFVPRLRANKDIPIKYIKEFELQLFQSFNLSVIYEIVNNDETTANYYNNQLKHNITLSLLDVIPQRKNIPPRIQAWRDYEKSRPYDTLKIHISDFLKVNNKKVELNKLSKALKPYINSELIVEYTYSKNTTYQDYINVFSAHKNAVWELRDMKNYIGLVAEKERNQFNRDEKLNEEIRQIEEKYPFRITERFE